MRKKQRNILIFSVIILLFIVLGVLYSQGIIKPFSTTSGTTYLSIDRVDNVGVGSQMVIFAQSGKGAENLKIEWTAQEINDQLKEQGENYMVDRGVTLDISMNKANYSFPINTPTNAFYYVQYQDLSDYIGCEWSCDLSDCSRTGVPQKGTYFRAFNIGFCAYPTKPNKCACGYYTVSEKVGTFGGGSYNLNYNLKVLLEGEEGNLSNQNNVITLKNGKVKLEEVGFTDSSNPLSPPTDYGVLWRSSGYVNLVNTNSYTYTTRYGSINNPTAYFNSYIGDGSNGLNNFLQGMSQYNGDVADAQVNRNNDYISNNQLSSISFEGSKMIVQPQYSRYNVQFKLYIDANWIGLQELKGDPEITSCPSDIELTSGQIESLSIGVRNKASSQGSFDYSTSCTGNPTINGFSSVLFNGGESKTLSLSISGSNTNPNSDLTGSCTHIVKDFKSQKQVTCTSKYKIIYDDNKCVNGEYRCLGTKQLQKCTNFIWGNEQECEKSCGYDKDLKRFACVNDSTCKNLGEGCGLLSSCCDGMKCSGFISGTCELIRNDTTCKSCNEWALNIFKSDEKKCTEGDVAKTTWWNPISWIGKLIGLTSQKVLCPIFLVIEAFIVVIILLLVMLLIGVGGSIFIFLKNLGRKIRGK